MPRTLTEQEKAQALATYADGISVKALAKLYRCRTATMTASLLEKGATLRPGGSGRTRFTEDEAKELAEKYDSGSSLEGLAKQYGSNTTTVSATLRRLGVKIRTPGVSKFWTEETVSLAIKMYQNGATQQEIAIRIGADQTAISRVLYLNKVVIKGRARREKHGSWKGGRRIVDGYVMIKPTNDDLLFCTPNSSGYVSEHRLVMGRSLGRKLLRTETVHHVNGDRLDNRLENLQVRQGHHGSGVAMFCNSCGSSDVSSRVLA